MTPVLLIWTLAAGSFLTMAVFEFVVAALERQPRIHVPFGLIGLSAMAGTIAEISSFGATSVAAMTLSIKWGVTFNILAHLFLVAFMVQYAGVRIRWPGWLAAGVFAVAGIVHLVLPSGITFSRIERVVTEVLPWGERIALPAGPAHPLWPLSVAAIPILLLFLGDLVAQTRRAGDVGRARRIAVAGTILFLAFVEGFLSDALVLKLPGFSTISFLGILALIGEDLVREILRAGTLAREVIASEQRWQDVIANVQVAVVGLTPDGRIESVNPFFERLVGLEGAELRGRSVLDLVLPSQREALTARLESLHNGSAAPHADWTLLRPDGEQRAVAWTTVRLMRDDHTVNGLLTLGIDVSERTRTRAELEQALDEVTQLREQLEGENVSLREELRENLGFSEIVGQSDALGYVLHRVRQVADTDLPVLLEGETGVGKELVARAIVQHSARGKGPFIRVNCAAIPASLVESELFGHERGAFTGADARRRGRFEVADGGTLFLDEIGDLPLDVQPRLLRVLEDGEFTRVGGEHPVRADVRLVAATNRVLREEVAAGRFREDLYFRLSTFVITVPPLRDRPEDIPLLVSHFVTTIAAKRGKTIDQIPRAVMERLTAYAWPGNVRELQNVVERSVLLSAGPELRLADRLDGELPERNGEEPRASQAIQTLEHVERRHIQRVLAQCKGRVGGAGGAAESLGINASTLRSRMKKLGILPRG
jgi:PAS domain S-box-containing protein